MNKIAKIIAGIILAGAASASIAAMIMKKNGTLDKFIENFKNKNKGGSCEFDADEILESSVCMICENSDDDKKHSKSFSDGHNDKKSYDMKDLKPQPNGKTLVF